MDVTVTDLPSPLASNKPGFSANITIINPSKELLTKIADGATWIYNYVSDKTSEAITNKITAQARTNPTATVSARNAKYSPSAISSAIKEKGMVEYYQSRLKAKIWAGYMVDGKPNYTNIITGFVNGSSFSHKGTDDVLKLGVYDIDINEISRETTSFEDEQLALDKEYYPGFMAESRWNTGNTKFANTWYESFKKYVKNFEQQWLDNDHSINIIVVRSLRDYFNSKSLDAPDGSVLDKQLEAKLKAQVMPKNDGISAYNMAGMLDGLCAAAKVGVDWRKVKDNVSVNTYLIFPLGGQRTITSGERANIQIWNYQNLLETPSIDGAGKMTIKMVFNPKCACDKSISLMLDKKLGATDVTRNVASFEGSITDKYGNMVGSIASTGNDALIANNQITGNVIVQSLRKQAYNSDRGGYLFNTAFPIIRVEHTLSTYKQDWTTTVKTVPIVGGLKFER